LRLFYVPDFELSRISQGRVSAERVFSSVPAFQEATAVNPAAFESLVRDIQTYGIRAPLNLWATAEHGLGVFDGLARARASLALGRTTVPVLVSANAPPETESPFCDEILSLREIVMLFPLHAPLEVRWNREGGDALYTKFPTWRA
jgi:hypothetical protein